MATLNQFFGGDGGARVVSPKAIYHLSQAVSLVNQKLNTSEALSNSNVTVVNFLVVQHLVRDAHSEAEVHLDGLDKMIELRGGLSQLGDRLLALKICR
jgi:hypothetical protein